MTPDETTDAAAPAAESAGEPVRFFMAVGRTQAARAAVIDNDTVRQDALLFRAGDYPDKGVTITAGDLHAMVARFYGAGGATCPVIQEHTPAPLDPLGQVVRLWVEGEELWGTLCFSAGVYAHIRERAGGRRAQISVALGRVAPEADASGEPVSGWELRETSLVFRGRVTGAGFTATPSARATLSRLEQAGKVTPAMRDPLLRLLSAPTPSDNAAATALFHESDPAAPDVARAAAQLVAALPVLFHTSGGSATVPGAAFVPPGGEMIPGAVCEMAARLGVDARRLWQEM